MVLALPGSIIHSNHIKPEVMLQAAMSDQGLLTSGAFLPEQAAVFTKWSLTYINQMPLTVPESQAAPIPNDLQTIQGIGDANAAEVAKAADKAKRDAEDDDIDTEVTLDEEEMEVEQNNQKGTDKIRTKKKMKRGEKQNNLGKMTEQIKGIEMAAEKRLAAKRDEQVAIEKDLLDLAKDIDERRTVLKNKAATVATELANVPKPPANAVMVPVLPGSIIHSNHIKPEVMLQAAMSDQGLLTSGAFSPEQAAVFTKWSLTYINQMSLTVPENQAAPMPNDLQTTQGMEDANAADVARAADKAKRDAEDDDVDTEVSLDELEMEVEQSNQKGTDKIRTKEQDKATQETNQANGKSSDQK